MKSILPRRRPAHAILLMLILVITAGGAAFVARDRIVEVAVAPAPAGTALPTAVSLTTGENAFYRYLGTRLRVLTAEARKLAVLGESRSRNVVELQTRASRIDDISGQIDRYLDATPVPARFVTAVSLYQTGIGVMRTGISETRAAFVRFDWNAVNSGLATFESGVDQVDLAFTTLQEAAGVGAQATPPTSADFGAFVLERA